MRRAARVDANHAEITHALRQCGWTVHDTSGVGGGFPDLVVGKAGRLVLVEIKDGAKKPSARRLTKAEALFWQKFGEAGVWVEIVESLEDATTL
jgi:Holliday junction resolvase